MNEWMFSLQSLFNHPFLLLFVMWPRGHKRISLLPKHSSRMNPAITSQNADPQNPELSTIATPASSPPWVLPGWEPHLLSLNSHCSQGKSGILTQEKSKMIGVRWLELGFFTNWSTLKVTHAISISLLERWNLPSIIFFWSCFYFHKHVSVCSFFLHKWIHYAYLLAPCFFHLTIWCNLI